MSAGQTWPHFPAECAALQRKKTTTSGAEDASTQLGEETANDHDDNASPASRRRGAYTPPGRRDGENEYEDEDDLWAPAYDVIRPGLPAEDDDEDAFVGAARLTEYRR